VVNTSPPPSRDIIVKDLQTVVSGWLQLVARLPWVSRLQRPPRILPTVQDQQSAKLQRVVIHLNRKQFRPVPLNTGLKLVRPDHHHPRSVILHTQKPSEF
jgi:hypothetical protein